MKKLLLMMLLAMPLLVGIAAVSVLTVGAAFADPPDPRPGKP
jgi:hypothetical protein